MNYVTILGGGGHAKVLASIILKLDDYKLIGYTDLNRKGELLGVPFLGNDDEFIKKYRNTNKYVALGVGQLDSPSLRKKLVSKYANAKFEFPTIISPDAIINNNVQIGVGSVIMDGVIVNAESQIGEYSIINTSSTIEHDCNIGSYVHIAPGVIMSGNVTVGDNCMIGVGSTIIQSIKICNNTFVGAGSVIVKSIEKAGKYFGIPARIVENKS